MIFVTVGTQLPFDRLMRGVDAWAKANPGIEVRAQTGVLKPGAYHPENMICAPTLEPESFNQLFHDAQLVIAHAGTGSLLQSYATRTPILIMPRQAARGEHRNDHQMATAAHFGSRPGVHVVYEEQELAPAIDNLLAGEPQAPDLQPFADAGLVEAVRSVIFPKG